MFPSFEEVDSLFAKSCLEIPSVEAVESLSVFSVDFELPSVDSLSEESGFELPSSDWVVDFGFELASSDWPVDFSSLFGASVTLLRFFDFLELFEICQHFY